MTDVVWSEEIFCPFFTEMWSLLSESTKPDYTSGKNPFLFKRHKKFVFARWKLSLKMNGLEKFCVMFYNFINFCIVLMNDSTNSTTASFCDVSCLSEIFPFFTASIYFYVSEGCHRVLLVKVYWQYFKGIAPTTESLE